MTAALLGGCSCQGSEDEKQSASGRGLNPGSVPICQDQGVQAARSQLIERIALPVSRPAPPPLHAGPVVVGEGFSMAGLRWRHGDRAGDWVHGMVFLPDPVPEGPLPLLVNFPGHWQAGVEAREIAWRSELFARAGWAVLNVASRGTEQASEPVPRWRAAHYGEGLYGELRARRGGKTPLGWDVVAGWGGIDAALAGRLGVPIESSRMAVMGFSGGAERATAVAATDPRIGAVVLGAYEYAFQTSQGQGMCSCGALKGGAEMAPQWLAQAGCRPGNPPTPRPVLAYRSATESGEPDPGSVLATLTDQVVVRDAPAGHGVPDALSLDAWVFLEGQLLGRARSVSEIEEAREGMARAYQAPPPSLRLAYEEGTAAPGRLEQGPPPWRGAGPVQVAVTRALLGLDAAAEAPRDPVFQQLAEPELRLRMQGDLRESLSWVVVVAPTPERSADGGGSVAVGARGWTEPPADGRAHPVLEHLPRSAGAIFVRPRIAGDEELDQRLSRWAIETGRPPLGVAVQDVLDARSQLRQSLKVDPAGIGFVGIGAGALPALWAAVLVGEGGPVVLVDAPVTLYWDGPESLQDDADGLTRDPAALQAPWPAWLLPSVPGGAALDPWLAARTLGDRVRWVRPLGGDGQPWTDRLPIGVAMDQGLGLFTAAGGP